MSTLPIPNISSLVSSTSLITTEVKIDNLVVHGIIRIGVEKSINGVPKAYITLHDGNAAAQDFPKAAQSNIAPGKKVIIKAGYNNRNEEVFKGFITKQSIRVTRSGRTRLELVCKTALSKMGLTPKSQYYNDTNEEGIMDTIVGRYSDISASYSIFGLPESHERVIQHNINDWDFLVCRAEQHGAYIVPKGDDISIESVPKVPLPVFSVAFGRDIIDLDLEMDSENQMENYKTEAWNYEDQEMTSSSSNPSLENTGGNISSSELAEVNNNEFLLRHSGNISDKQLELWAKSKELKAKWSKINGTVTIQGTHLAELNSFFNLTGISGRYNGLELITGIVHEISGGNWRTTLQIGLSKTWHAERFQEAEKLEAINAASVNGVYLGIVKNVHEDPKSNFRLFVNIPSIQSGDQGSWMRLLSFDASAGKGFVNRPDIGDEVAVGFVNNDVNHGIILGALYSKSNNGSELLQPVEENNIKGWVLKENLHLLFNSKDEEEYVELKTPIGNVVTIDKDKIQIEDHHSNVITMDSSGISMKTQKDFTIEAQGKINLKGMDIENSASSSFKAKGSMMELKADGMSTIKGNPVNIN